MGFHIHAARFKTENPPTGPLTHPPSLKLRRASLSPLRGARVSKTG